MKANQTLPPKYRVRRQVDFDRLHRRNVFAADGCLVIRGCENGLGHARLGLSVSRKVGNAVMRNRWKRRIREVFRHCRGRLPAGIDFVVRPRRGAKLDYHAIERSFYPLAVQLSRRLAKSKAKSN